MLLLPTRLFIESLLRHILILNRTDTAIHAVNLPGSIRLRMKRWIWLLQLHNDMIPMIWQSQVWYRVLNYRYDFNYDYEGWLNIYNKRRKVTITMTKILSVIMIIKWKDNSVEDNYDGTNDDSNMLNTIILHYHYHHCDPRHYIIMVNNILLISNPL